ncbi:hypothetical protein BGX28_003157 [Mortierella sp. GBA30]|nr:hypothetical protein BGX28_003157 [Mortierella sp. GBA30]
MSSTKSTGISSTGFLLKSEAPLHFDPTALRQSWQRHSSVDNCQCRKRIFADAIELTRPLGTNPPTADQYPGWIDSIKRRKIHQFATKWTSTLSPSPYVKLMTVKSFWDMMGARLDLSWLDEKESEERHADHIPDGHSIERIRGEDFNDTAKSSLASARISETVIPLLKAEEQVRLQCLDGYSRRAAVVRTVRYYHCPKRSLKGLWEEELREQRVQQMIPDAVRRPPRNRIFNSRPIPFSTEPSKPRLPSLLEPSPSLTHSEALNKAISVDTTVAKNATMSVGDGSDNVTKNDGSQPVLAELDLFLKKKNRAAAIVRSHAISEGSDMAEYKPWKDGTVLPRQGSLSSLKDLRSHIMDPWPTEEAKSRDECSRILHRMREQLNVVINLQIHLRSMIKTAPTQLSFLLSIRHPAQVSIELLLALYGPHFTQTSNFRAIEQLLWGSHGHSQPQAQADTSPS